MTKSDVYFGAEQEVEFNESYTKTPPTISAIKTDSIIHNTNVTLELTNTSKTLDVSAWLEAPDFLLKVHPLPRGNKAYLENGTVLQTEYASGKRVTTSYTTGVVGSELKTTVTFAANAFGAVQKFVVYPHRQGTFYIQIGFTDVGSVAHTIIIYMKPSSKPSVIDLARYKIDRSIAMTITVVFHDSASTHGLEDNVYIGSNIIYGFMTDPVEIQICCYNSLDTDAITVEKPKSVNYSTLLSYFTRYQSFLTQHPSPFSIPMINWLETLAIGADYAISQGWTTVAKFNNLDECRNYSLRLVGLYSKVISGDFTDPTIPDHFVRQIEAMLQSNGTTLNDVLLFAAIWALCDDITLEISN